MKTTIFYLFLMTFVFIPKFASAQECMIHITSHSDGQKVNQTSLNIKGTAKTPANGHVWVLVRIVGINGWYPQGGGEVYIEENSSWECNIHLGREGETGSYQIAVAVVNDKENEALNTWVKKTSESGQYNPITFPGVMDGCSVKKIKMEK